jgi:hypothetical protein
VKKLLVDGFTTKIACPTGSFRVLVYPSGVDVSTSTLRYLSACLRTRRRVSGANQYRVEPWPLVSTVVPPIMVVFSTAPVWPAGGPAGRAVRVEPDRARLADLAQRLRDERLKPIVGAVRTLREAPSAFAPRRRTPGKTIIRVTEN